MAIYAIQDPNDGILLYLDEDLSTGEQSLRKEVCAPGETSEKVPFITTDKQFLEHFLSKLYENDAAPRITVDGLGVQSILNLQIVELVPK